MLNALFTDPGVAEKRHKTAEIRQLLLKLGISVPDDWNPDNAGSQDVLLAAVKTANLIRQKCEAKEAAEKPKDPTAITTDDPNDSFENTPKNQQFSESRPGRCGLHVTPPRARAIIAAKASWRPRR